MEKAVWLKCFETLFPFFSFFLAGARFEGENKMTCLAQSFFFTTNTDNSVLFRTFSFHSQSQTRQKKQW